MNNHIEEKFYKELVEMSPLKGRDMHNRPPLYDTPDEKIEEIKQFIKQALQEQRQSILEEIEEMKTDERKVYYFGKEPNCYGAETYQEKMLVNAVLEDIKEILKDNKE